MFQEKLMSCTDLDIEICENGNLPRRKTLYELLKQIPIYSNQSCKIRFMSKNNFSYILFPSVFFYICGSEDIVREIFSYK